MAVSTKQRAAPATVPAPEQGETALAPLPQANGSATPAATLERPAPERGQRPRNLYAALAVAQDRCAAAHHDRRNAFHRYDYASTEAVLLAAQEAMAGTGLSVLPLGWDVAFVPGSPLPILKCAFQVCHESGESTPAAAVVWPIVEEKGRPLDKALAIALTASLGYYLRGLLRMPRVRPEDQMEAREDAAPAPAPQRQPAVADAPAPPPASAYVPPPPPAPPADEQPMSEPQKQRIDALVRELGLTGEAVSKRLVQVFGPDKADWLTLSENQARQLIVMLELAAKLKKGAPAAPKS